MSKMFRLSKSEEKALLDKCVEVNKILIRDGKQPVKDSELLHCILKDAIKLTEVNSRGEVKLGV